MAIFAFSCALLVEPLAGAQAPMNRAGERLHRRETRKRWDDKSADEYPEAAVGGADTADWDTPSAPGAGVSLPRQQPGKLWGAGVTWPAEWRKPEGTDGSDAPR